ncbi:hypothetical protein ACQPZU_09975 [Saccharomonospora azurea]|uniref:hypothetical protein n=1 Tax=Saccharomonospora azurea TaxID=40988 RepID=UPI003D90F7D8
MRSPPSVTEPEETLIGQDADQVVQVVASAEADVIAVRLSPQWRQVVDPRALYTSVLTAANAATASALARSVELTNTISTEQTSISQKVHDLGDEWARSNIGAMQNKSDGEVR